MSYPSGPGVRGPHRSRVGGRHGHPGHPGHGAGAGAGGNGAAQGTPSPDDYMSIIQSDPVYKQAVADENAASASDSANLGAGILSALVQRGIVPNIDAVAQQLGLSPEVVNWIKSNVDLGRAGNLAKQANSSGVSTEAQLERAHATAMQNIKDSLAARGMVASGATPFLTGSEETRYTGAQYNANKALADYIAGAYGAFAKAEQGRQGDLRAALEAAYQRALQNQDSIPVGHAGAGAGPGAGTGAGPVPGTGSSLPNPGAGGPELPPPRHIGGPVPGVGVPGPRPHIVHALRRRPGGFLHPGVDL